METEGSSLSHRNGYNITAMSFSPEELAAAIRKHIPTFSMRYEVDPVRQAIADSWPRSMDDSAARREWGWQPHFAMAEMVSDMLAKLNSSMEKGE
jgi:nucleoside-diphosphate-sugar epimerase